MSHVVSIDQEIVDLDCLKAACTQLGFEFKENQKTYAWFGQWVGDTQKPADLEIADMGKCDHAIKVPGATYEVGVKRSEKGTYKLQYDYWGAGGLKQKLGGTKAERLVQAYGVERVKKIARKKLNGKVVSESKLQNGDVRLKIKVGN